MIEDINVKTSFFKTELHEDIRHFLNELISQAIQISASDIHFEPGLHEARIRIRQAGKLIEKNSISLSFLQRLITAIKIMANLDIAERRMPQDGAFIFYEQNKDIRVSTCPNLYGEKVVLRLFTLSLCELSLDHLGLEISQKNMLFKKINLMQGLILISAPTGQGKTLTLYSILSYLNKVEKNIMTIEDPVEIKIPGIVQVNVNPEVGLTFKVLLKAFLRQDPDVIMVGEIRDLETAMIAIEAAQTGHLVLATLHAKSALSSLYRLQLLGLPLHYFSDSLSLLISQRLVKLKNDAQQKSRTGIFELISVSHELIHFFIKHNSVSQLKEYLASQCLFLKEAGLKKVKDGIITQEALIQVLGDEVI